ncbi:hypothetical protein CBG25_06015 [Arsenophonus sp. ENCA]|nr:hypothetical protein CBG25_06015 [Arsenophonus sp. ENCA]
MHNVLWVCCVSTGNGPYWHVHFAKPTKNAWRTAKYLGRYLKKPPVSGCRLAHYDGGSRITLPRVSHRHIKF